MATIDLNSIKLFLDNLEVDAKDVDIRKDEAIIKESEARFKEILQEEISRLTIKSEFMMKLESTITISTVENSFSIDINFAERVHRRSVFYEFTRKEVYMPYILNNEWKSYPRKRYLKYDEHGKLVLTVRSFPASNRGFMNRAVERFNDEFLEYGIVAKANTNYR